MANVPNRPFSTLEQRIYLLNELKEIGILEPTPFCDSVSCHLKQHLMVIIFKIHLKIDN